MDLNSINKRPIWNKDQTCNYMACYAFNEYIDGLDSQVSDSVFQNIIYSIAKEIHGYTWNNDKLELAWFYTWDGDTTWIYMDDARRINDVTWFLFFGAKDESIENPDKLTKSQALKMIVWEVDLDSTVEVADKSLTTEFRKRVKAIIEREYSYRENKIDYEKQIIDFIKSNNEWQDWYVEIPAHIALNAKRAWIWDVHKFLFRIENGQIYALSRGDMVNTVLNFEEPNIKIKYEAVNPIRTELSDQEKKIISYVDGMEKKLDKLRGKQEQHLVWEEHEEDLDIPVELERAMSQKSIEWDKLKQSILYMDPYTALDCLAEKSKEYYDFFHWMYLWIMNRVTNMAWVDSNDLNNSANFLYATQFIWFEVASIKNNKLEISDLVNESIKEYLPGLFEWYKDWSTWKTVKELLMSKDEKEQKIWQELANKIYELCLEETVLEFDKSWNVTNISTVDFSSNDLEKVKKKIGEWLKWVWFLQASEDYKNTAVQPIEWEFTIRNVEKAEVDTHKEIKKMTDAIVNTMRNVDRGNKRGEPEFIADLEQKADWKISWALKSYKKYSEKITVNMDKSGNIKSITVDWLWMTFTNPQEWFRVANLINWIKHHVDQHPRWSSAKATWQPFKTTHGKYMWENGELQRDITNYAFDTTILEEETCKEYYPTIYKEKKFTNYVNKFNK